MSVASLASVVLGLALLDVLLFFLVRRVRSEPVPLSVVGSVSWSVQLPGRDRTLLAFRTAALSWMLYITTHQLRFDYFWTFDLAYFTVLSWLLLNAYFAVAVCASVKHLRAKAQGASSESMSPRILSQQHSVGSANMSLPRLCQLLLSAAVPSALALDVFLWLVIFPHDPDPEKRTELHFVAINEHFVNFVLVAIEVSINSIPLRLADLPLVACWGVLYEHYLVARVALKPSKSSCLLAYEEGKCSTYFWPTPICVWPYPFMDTSKPYALPVYYLLIAGFSLSYVIVCHVARQRKVLTCMDKERLPTLLASSPSKCQEVKGCPLQLMQDVEDVSPAKHRHLSPASWRV